jgi:Ni/Co efflux regulator RcnB
MPLPLAPLAGLALRAGLVAVTAYAARRALVARAASLQTVGRTDQRAEDALDDANEGLALHRPADRRENGEQTNLSARLRRTIRWGDRGVEIDAAVLGRFRIRRV